MTAPKAANRALPHFFQPRSVAVIGASRDEAAVGHACLKNMISCGYAGKVYAVNPHADEVLGVKCHPSVLDIPDPVDLGLIVVPARFVLSVMQECAQKAIDSVIIISAGFKESGPEGAELERQVAAFGREHGIRIVGPNCLGIIVPAIGLNASFAPSMPAAGQMAIMSQSGALATAVLDWAVDQGFGFSKFISFGNRADVGFSDFLHAWKDDPDTRVILIYMEGVDNGATFIEAARQVSRVKPVVVVKSGGTAAGARAVSSHTGSLAGAESAYEAAFRQTGVIRAHSVEDLFDYAIAFAFQPLPKGEALGIVTNAGGPGIMATDATERAGLRLANLEKATVDCLRTKLPPASNFYNPVDVLGDADADRYGYAASCLISDPNVHAMVAVLTPQAMTQPVECANAVADAAGRQNGKPIFGCFMGGRMMSAGERRLDDRRIPSYPVPERAVSAFAAMVGYKRWLDRPAGQPVTFEVDRDLARQVFAQARQDRRSDLGEVEARQVLTGYGFKVPAGRLAHTSDEALAAAAGIGYPVVLKIASPDILHKSDIGGVRVNLTSPEQVQDAFDLLTLRARRFMPDADIWGCLVQEMVSGGREVILGVSRDPQFGPLLMFGLGGIYVEVLKDVAFRLAPLTRDDAREMITEIRSYPLLAGARGQKAADSGAIVDGLLRLSQLVCDFPEIVEMDINPLSVMDADHGAVAMDARITIAHREGEG